MQFSSRTRATRTVSVLPLGSGASHASTTLERMQAQERQLLEQHVASRARLVEPKKKAYTAEAGWRRTADGGNLGGKSGRQTVQYVLGVVGNARGVV